MRAIAVVWCCFLARALFYCSAIPMWEGFDEYSHFAMVERIALGRGLPDARTAVISKRVAASLELAPVPWVVREHGWLRHDEFWQLSPQERSRRSQELRALPAGWANEESGPPRGLWEAQQPPLYYWLATPVFLATRGFSLAAQVWILRCLTALAASLAIPCTFFVARELLAERYALGAAILVASMPELLISACRVANEGLAIALASIIICLGVAKRNAWMSVALGAGLITKAYFLAFLPWYLYVLFRNRGLRWIPLCLAIGGWWYVHQWMLTGTITGEQHDLVARAFSQTSVTASALRMPWRHTLDFAATSFIWLGDWSFLALRTWMYRAMEVMLAIAAIGAVIRMRRARELAGLAGLALCFAAGLAYHAIAGFRASNDAASMGYYFYCIVVPIAILITAGLGPFVAVAQSLFLAIELFGLWIYMLPYYAGLILHDAAGNLPAGRVSMIGLGMFRNLATNKPFGAGELIAMAVVYLLATAVLWFMGVRSISEAARRGAKLRA